MCYVVALVLVFVAVAIQKTHALYPRVTSVLCHECANSKGFPKQVYVLKRFILHRQESRLDYQPLFGKGAEIEPNKNQLFLYSEKCIRHTF